MPGQSVLVPYLYSGVSLAHLIRFSTKKKDSPQFYSMPSPCEIDGCDNTANDVIPGTVAFPNPPNLYCNFHRCSIPGCFKRHFEGFKTCGKDHSCLMTGCHTQHMCESMLFCDVHECRYEGCESSNRGWLTRSCEKHQCDVDGCEYACAFLVEGAVTKYCPAHYGVVKEGG